MTQTILFNNRYSVYYASSVTCILICLAIVILLPAKKITPQLMQFDKPANKELQLGQWSIFGIDHQSELPQTSLSLNLLGVIAGQTRETSQAIIASHDGAEDIYSVGATLPGGAILYSVLDDKVVLQYYGKLETLTLADETDAV